jgi:hypothetical protein
VGDLHRDLARPCLSELPVETNRSRRCNSRLGVAEGRELGEEDVTTLLSRVDHAVSDR